MLRLFGKKSKEPFYSDSEGKVDEFQELLKKSGLFDVPKKESRPTEKSGNKIINYYRFAEPIRGLFDWLTVRVFNANMGFSIELESTLEIKSVNSVQELIDSLFKVFSQDSNGLKPIGKVNPTDTFGAVFYVWELNRKGEVVEECSEKDFWFGIYFTYTDSKCSLSITDCHTFINLEDIVKLT